MSLFQAEPQEAEEQEPQEDEDENDDDLNMGVEEGEAEVAMDEVHEYQVKVSNCSHSKPKNFTNHFRRKNP